MTKIRRNERPRRIAADEAHSWARNLRLGNHHGKNVLKALTLYVDGDGYCFTAISTLAWDVELSDDTVRRRLQWLEEIGAIVRHPQWIDERGVRNGDGRGKRTSDNIRLMFDGDQAEIEARAAGQSEPVSREVSPSSLRGLNNGADPICYNVSPAPALGQPSHCGEGLISEPEPESSPLPPSRGRESDDQDPDLEESEPEHFDPAWRGWRGHEVMRRDLALAEFRKLDPDKQRLCRAAVPLFWALQDRLKRSTVPNFHTWIRSGGFLEFPTATLEPRPSSTSYAADGREAQAIKGLFGFARVPVFEHRGEVVYPLPVTAQVLAFAALPARSAWQWIEERGQLAAWGQFLAAHIHKPRPDLTITRNDGDAPRRGFWAPWPWPPRKDGTISPAGEQVEGDA